MWDVCVEDIAALSPVESDLLIVLGGPIGAYQDDPFPILLGTTGRAHAASVNQRQMPMRGAVGVLARGFVPLGRSHLDDSTDRGDAA